MSDDITVGDRFEITMEVVTTQEGGSWCRPLGVTDDMNYIPKSALLAGRRLPRAVKVGDRVKGLVSSFSGRGAVLAVDGNEAWVKWSDGSRSTASLAHLTLIPGDET